MDPIALRDIFLEIFFMGYAIILHEYAHGWMASRLGDPTAKEAGRLTLNPLKHIDPVGTIILPGTLLIMSLFSHNNMIFGWAKPVPVNFLRLNNPKRDMILVGLAGPATNIALAYLFSLILKFNSAFQFHDIIVFAVYINLLLAVFNMIPIPPLDGSRLMMGLLPNKIALAYSRLEPYGILIVFALLYMGLFEVFVLPVVAVIGYLLGVSFL